MRSSSAADCFSDAHMSTPASSLPPTDADDGANAVSRAMRAEENSMRAAREEQDRQGADRLERERQHDISGGKDALDKKFQQLEFLMNKSKLYADVMLAQMQRQEDDEKARDEKTAGQTRRCEADAQSTAAVSQRRATRASTARGQPTANRTSKDELDKLRRGRGRPRKTESKISNYFKKEDVAKKADDAAAADDGDHVATSDIGVQGLKSARQPALVTGGTMRSYQLEGLEWLLSLYENGINGILADEMGLGKTIQTIALLAHLWEKQSYGPFLIAAPLSTTSNWVDEFRKWTPQIPVVLYHGSQPERAELRRSQLKHPGTDRFPVVVTSYEICMNDRKYLTGFGWQFIIIDEGHRIKNLDCRLIRELQSYKSANRLLITGTPLQNNLTELWSLLHFLLPTVFDKLATFEAWFDFSGLKDRRSFEQLLSEDRQQYLVKSLHAVLKPFLLRRVKTDVEALMPKKREYILFAPLMPLQRELYQAIFDGNSRAFLEQKAFEHLVDNMDSRTSSAQSLKRKAADDLRRSPKSAKAANGDSPTSGGRRRGRPRKSYKEVSDAQYFAQLDAPSPREPESRSASPDALSVAALRELAKRQVGGKKLQNAMMQLRLCCNSPYAFFDPFVCVDMASPAQRNAGTVPHAVAAPPDERVVASSGKMRLLDALLPALLARDHKVLIFSQFTSTLDLLALYLELRGHGHARIDGSVAQAERHAQIQAFNQPSAAARADPVDVFLLSTRAGGQGINLAAADTVVLFDSDWNPQQDLQAMDRAHRIGQTRNVVVFRLATRHTVEQRLLESAEAKRRLEKLVIRKGGVRNGAANGTRRANGAMADPDDELAELQKLLRRADGEHVHADDLPDHNNGSLLSQHDLNILLDRSDDAYVRAEKGLDAGGAESVFQAVEKRGEGALMEGLRA